jgi:hypothetical protein
MRCTLVEAAAPLFDRSQTGAVARAIFSSVFK